MATIKRMGAPTMKTKGSIGDIYQDLKSGKTYVCKSAYRDSAGTEDYNWQLMPAVNVKNKPEPKAPAPIPVVVEEPVEEIEEEQPTQVEEDTPVAEQKPERPRHNYNKQYNKHNRN